MLGWNSFAYAPEMTMAVKTIRKKALPTSEYVTNFLLQVRRSGGARNSPTQRLTSPIGGG